MTTKIFKLGMVLLAILLGGWFLHQQFLTLVAGIDQKILIAAYGINYVLGMGIFMAVLFVHRHHPMIAGYVFLTGSGIKFLVFFLFFYPFFMNDGDLSREEFAIFFVPYIATLTTTVVASARVLNTNVSA